ncbi:polysaccharide export protein [Parabacteroides sp. 52]|uniref:polysaccharide biosynthesis/export family protein n=1 Tax=unclassified Parabacteroides TaxID=2649774 RepID=UPI0013D4EA19|nr:MULTISPECIES: polysaccharide biosynthesis/export family protein [unclassified Parabacteroides]MDH6534543.1 polysaccharide export outer membrane protein [Parabacteroides sp. PM5-20]NDV55221.1 polysaccharide export protein [Parabacteroides sp. 52]
MRLKLAAFVFLFVLFFGACSAPKDVVYFQGIEELTPAQFEEMAQTYRTPICPDDLLTITVTSWDPHVVTPFNPPTYAYSSMVEGEVVVQAAPALLTYAVDANGDINYPVLGKIHVQGLTKHELEDQLKKDISQYIEDPIVKVQIVNFKVTVLGEVNRPGPISIKTDRISILDALGHVGDLTINARRDNIMILRDNNGKKEVGFIDITDPALFASPFYYLKQNDAIYVTPNKAKIRNARYSQAQQYNITVFSSILSAVSVITTVILAIRK